MFHRSQRLLLRPIWPEDWQGVLAGIADEGEDRLVRRVRMAGGARDQSVDPARAAVGGRAPALRLRDRQEIRDRPVCTP